MSGLPDVMLPRTERTDSWLHRYRAVIVDAQDRPVILDDGKPWWTPPCFTRSGALRKTRAKIARLRAARTWTA